ncbi:site-specific integrase [Streptomyces sp. NPDC056230]|uniref:site-specific integrase n=1 Tax=Streptomyces sp. NPDC056230 TaxID=3345754 RepID=UPI0035E12C70
MQLFFADQRKVWKVGQVVGLGRAELSALFARRPAPAGTPILLDEAMRPVEPVSSWFRSLALERRDAKTMRSDAYSVLMLLHFLASRDADLLSATETDLREFRIFRQDEAEKVVDDAAWGRDWAAVESLYRYLIRTGAVARRPWRATPQRSGLGSRIRPDLRVRKSEDTQV